MITYEVEDRDFQRNIAKFSMKGLSTDTKPTVEHDGIGIENGSSFFEIDSKDLKFYDRDSESWV